MDRVLNDALSDILQPSQQKQVVERVRQVIVQKSHSGPLPSEDTVRGYEQASPGSFNRIIAMAEKDQDAVITSSTFKAKSDSDYRMACLGMGLIALLVLVGGIVYLGMNDRPAAAASIAGMGAIGIVGAFINAWWGRKS